MEYLSNIELYYTKPENFLKAEIILTGDDFRHALKVMRHKTGDLIFITNGSGKIFKCEITGIEKDRLLLKEIESYNYKNKFKNIYFCLPKLKNPNRFEFALEKCVELGITNFIIYDAVRAVAKGNKSDRWNKIALAAMKQSLRSFLPEIKTIENLNEIKGLKGKKIVFEQNGDSVFDSNEINYNENSYFIFGPEGGLSQDELDYFEKGEIYTLAENRLRSETAIVVCASLL